ncbi:M23 family metallopeptidase [Radiobacillus kanasensis]|uniref:M23 family metallopeptidase n=1 Tax=Radiobacillus kanasensis TaxID=2844358 RepID=UPI001E2C0A4A|nr:M23 family metallopeptidase [Radiobacillus kanasensis]UFT99394.1 M23 family metallopeptidase [Radiobacillus kanasensis]
MWNDKYDQKIKHINRKQPAYSIIKKTAITTCIGLSLTFQVAYAEENSDLSTVYHVYVNGDHLGTVDSKEVIETYVEKRLNEQEKKNKDYAYTIGENISYIPEKVFNHQSENSDVINALGDELSIKVNAYELKIGDKVVGFFKSEEEANLALTELKEKYVKPEVLKQLEQSAVLSAKEVAPDSKQAAPTAKKELSVGESMITNVVFSEEVAISQQKSNEKDILTVEQGLKLLQKGTLTEKVHKVKEGEVLGAIAAKYNLDTEKLLELNPKITEETLLQIDQKLNVTDYEPFLDVVVKEEKLVDEEIAYEKEVIESDELYKGQTKVKQEGQNGSKRVHYLVEKVNGNVASQKVLDEQVTKEPVKEVIIKGTKVVPSRGTGNLQWPAVGGFITSGQGSRWGSYHKGIDISGVGNRSILAADNGTVVSAGWDDGGYGNKIIIDHNNGYRTVYAHLSSISVSSGQTVTQGTKIGVMGSTGNSTGVHLHFELYKNGALVNPSGQF